VNPDSLIKQRNITKSMDAFSQFLTFSRRFHTLAMVLPPAVLWLSQWLLFTFLTFNLSRSYADTIEVDPYPIYNAYNVFYESIDEYRTSMD
jgi:hypothetical protein